MKRGLSTWRNLIWWLFIFACLAIYAGLLWLMGQVWLNAHWSVALLLTLICCDYYIAKLIDRVWKALK